MWKYITILSGAIILAVNHEIVIATILCLMAFFVALMREE